MEDSMNSKRALPWQIAQERVAAILKQMGIDYWIEQPLNGYRVDVLGKYQAKKKLYYIIFEVKHYQSITPKQEIDFEKQMVNYVAELIKREARKKSPNTILEKYVFIGYLVLAKDYALMRNRKMNWRKESPFDKNQVEFNKIWKRNVKLFCSTPEHIKENLANIGIIPSKQSNLERFFS